VTVEFIAMNASDVVAKGVNVMVRISHQSSFASEPEGFTRAKGSPEQDRSRYLNRIHAGVITEKMMVQVKVPPPPISGMAMDFFYRCDNCEVEEFQKLYVDLLR